VLSGPSHNRKIVSGPLSKRIVVRLQELVDYPSFLSTEYYNGFLRQLRIYHEAIVYLTSQNKVLGFISLYKPEGSIDFSKDEIEILKMISPYIAVTLETIDLRNKSGIKDAVIETMGERFHQGLLLLNESMKLVYLNQKAREFCKDIQRDISMRRNIRHPIPGILLEDCYPLKEEFKSIPSIFPILPKCRIIESKGKRYSVRSQVVENDMHIGKKNFFLVLIDQISDLNSLNEERIKEFFHLTKREIEIVTYIFKGLRYTEIAEKLFISVFTVKKHIQNISQKLGVNNRTALVHKILCTCDLDVIQMTEG
jgi:DNA-binding CsgD family transcriptional regulator